MRKHSAVWDLRSPTRKGNSEFVRISVGETSEGMGQILGKCCLRLAAIRAGVRELSGWWHTQATDYNVRHEGLVLFVKPPRLCYLLSGSLDRKSSCRAPTEGHENDPHSVNCHSRRRVAIKRRTEPSVSGGLKTTVWLIPLFDGMSQVCLTPGRWPSKLRIFDVSGSIHPPVVMTSERLL